MAWVFSDIDFFAMLGFMILFAAISLVLACKIRRLREKYKDLSKERDNLLAELGAPPEYMALNKVSTNLALIPVVILTVVLAIVLLSGVAESKFTTNPIVKPGDVYTAAATIAGLAVFGSVLGVKISGSAETYPNRFIGATMMLCGSISVIIIQVWIMYHACCVGLNDTIFWLYMFGTVTTLAAIIVGFTIILDVWIRRPSIDGGTS